MLRSILELVEFVSNSSTNQKLPVVFDRFPLKQKELLELLLNAPTIKDDQAMQILYPNGKRKTYLKLKERLHHRLMEVVLGSSSEKRSMTYQEIRERSIKQTALLRVLLFRGLPVNVEQQSKKMINLFLRYQFNDLLKEVLIINLELYGRGYQNEKKFLQLSRLYDSVSRKVDLENEIQIKYFKYFVDFSTSKKLSNPDTISQLKVDAEFYKDQIANNLSFKSVFFSLNALCIIYEILNEQGQIVEYVHTALKYLNDKPQNSTALQLSFLQKKFRAQLKLGQTKELVNTLDELDSKIEKYSISYYQVSLYKLIMWCHDAKYELAIEEYDRIHDRKFESRVPNNVQEFFSVIYAYLAFLSEAKVFNHIHFENKKYRVFKFLNEVPIYSQDKKGVNISILVLHILFLLERRKYDDIIDRLESLRLYSYRYLRKDDTFRSNCFIKMIIQMTRANFHPIRTERYTEELLIKLKSVPLELSEQPLEVEIIPYENLWEIVMQLLERNSKIKRGRPKKIR